MERMPGWAKLRKTSRSVPRPRPFGRLIAIVNSAFFLWLITALFVTVGGNYFTQVQKCTADADMLIDRYNALREEQLNRHSYYADAIHKAKLPTDLMDVRDKYFSGAPELQNKHYAAISRELKLVLAKSLGGKEEQYRKALPSTLSEMFIDAISLMPADKRQLGLDNAKNWVKEDQKESNEKPILTLESNCSPGAIMRQLLRGDRNVIRPVLIWPPKNGF